MKRRPDYFQTRAFGSEFWTMLVIAVGGIVAMFLWYMVDMICKIWDSAGLRVAWITFVLLGMICTTFHGVYFLVAHGPRVSVYESGVLKRWLQNEKDAGRFLPWEEVRQCGLLSGKPAGKRTRHYVFFARYPLPEGAICPVDGRYPLLWPEVILLKIDLQDAKRLEEICARYGKSFTDYRMEGCRQPY